MHYQIRRLAPSDAAALHRLRTCPGVVRNTLQQPFQSLASVQQLLDNFPPHIHALVACTPDGELVGCGGLHLAIPPRRRHTALLFLMVRDDWQGKGVGGALMRALLDYADNWLDLKRIELDAVHDNHGAIALYERYGFEHEGVARGFNLREGVYEDAVLMARLRFRPGEHAASTRPAEPATRPAPRQDRPRQLFHLRHSELDDAAGVAALMAHDSVQANTLQLPYPDENAWRQRLSDCKYSLVAEAADGSIVGNAAIWQPGDNPRLAHIAELGIIVHPAQHGQGVGSALLQALLGQVSDYLPYRRLQLKVFSDNAPAIALYEKYGFVREATLRGDGLRHGAYHDCLLMARAVK
ncbi:L-amino acid N-acyltransferase YncA [Vogesella indigofera]|uniref:L-amino acid N-acyltransferase YncA n=1 Tax=Vogesella indigofera TaxID=45465 RepID=A0A495BDI2_VOGIN|nr:GNAT family N-acetyltransferase [Vogesella indigofera]RKQ59051.1 L-amino acid N-acyltransferase YncA [Vogesella indigofera]